MAWKEQTRSVGRCQSLLTVERVFCDWVRGLGQLDAAGLEPLHQAPAPGVNALAHTDVALRAHRSRMTGKAWTRRGRARGLPEPLCCGWAATSVGTGGHCPVSEPGGVDPNKYWHMHTQRSPHSSPVAPRRGRTGPSCAAVATRARCGTGRLLVGPQSPRGRRVARTLRVRRSGSESVGGPWGLVGVTSESLICCELSLGARLGSSWRFLGIIPDDPGPDVHSW